MAFVIPSCNDTKVIVVDTEFTFVVSPALITSNEIFASMLIENGALEVMGLAMLENLLK